jgi:hypothetical protein
MATKRMFARGFVLIVAGIMAVTAFDVAHAASKKSKHAKSPAVPHAAGAPSGTQPAPPGLPDPGVYK